MKNYYEEHASEYVNATITCDMKEQYHFFLKHLPKKGKILDLGFGSGRDMLYFHSLGYEVEGLDPTPTFIKNMEEKGFKVYLLYAEEMNFKEEYDAIWACASLIHVQRKDLKNTLIKCMNALKKNGILYCSFKYGKEEITKDDRYFNYLNEDMIKEILLDIPLSLIDIMISQDVRNERKDEKWLNVLLKK